MTGEPDNGWSLRRRGVDTVLQTALAARRQPRIPGAAVLGLAAALALAACDGEGGGPPGTSRASGAAAEGADEARAAQPGDGDVEAPEVFQVTDQGLWDGRPSLGGVWVAHPDVTDPERVVIRNQENGRSVTGALFRRERENPGPALQVSSDAAEALAMLAGAPATLSVTALRREDAERPGPGEAAAPVERPDGSAAPPPDATLDTVPDTAPAAAADPARAESVAQATAALLADAPAAPAQAAADPDAPPLEQPFVQLGIFSVEANADALARRMTAVGLPARAVASATQGQDVWRVLVGPAATEAQRAAFEAEVEAQGFADAFPVRS